MNNVKAESFGCMTSSEITMPVGYVSPEPCLEPTIHQNDTIFSVDLTVGRMRLCVDKKTGDVKISDPDKRIVKARFLSLYGDHRVNHIINIVRPMRYRSSLNVKQQRVGTFLNDSYSLRYTIIKGRQFLRVGFNQHRHYKCNEYSNFESYIWMHLHS